jgi:hypothetical protein
MIDAFPVSILDVKVPAWLRPAPARTPGCAQARDAIPDWYRDSANAICNLHTFRLTMEAVLGGLIPHFVTLSYRQFAGLTTQNARYYNISQP